jgi:flagellin-like protein
MDIKKLFMDNKAVSPVIGVILMVAITVILAAAIGSSVFGQGTAQSAPQANLDMQSMGTSGTDGIVKIEHLGGDPINFGESSMKVSAYINGTTSSSTNATDIGVMNVGDIKIIKVLSVNKGANVNIKCIDKATNQLICDKDIRF